MSDSPDVTDGPFVLTQEKEALIRKWMKIYKENDLARAEWYKVYGIIFNKLKEGEAAYKKVVDAASASEKKAALDLLKKRAEERKVRLDDEAEEEADD